MKKIYILAAAAAIITAVLLYFYLDSLTDKKDGNQETVVIAIVDIPAYTKINANMIATVEMPSTAVHPSALHSRSEALGKVTDSNIVAGEVILSAQMKDMGSSTDAMAFMVEDGMRAISIEVDPVTGVSGYIRQGDRVDVYVTANTKTAGSAAADVPMCFAIAENLDVLAVGTTIADSSTSESGTIEYLTVTLMAEPKTAQTLAYAEAQGEIHLSLRSATDESMNNYSITYNLSKSTYWN